MAEVIAKSQIQHNGKSYAAEQKLSCSDEQAEALVQSGAAELVPEPKKEKPKKEEPKK